MEFLHNYLNVKKDKYVVTCHTIIVTNYCFTWCSAKGDFDTCFGSIISYMGKFYFEDFLNCYFELFGENYMKIISTGQVFLLNYDLSRFLK
jgi:hypothetical protein